VRIEHLGGAAMTTAYTDDPDNGILTADVNGDMIKWDENTLIGAFAWLRTGNTITDGNNILGTLNNVDIDIQTNSTSHFVIDAATGGLTQQASAGNITFTGVLNAQDRGNQIGSATANQQLTVNGNANAVVGNTLGGNPAVWDLVVQGDQVTTGLVKVGGSMWLDGTSAIHSITTNASLDISADGGAVSINANDDITVDPGATSNNIVLNNVATTTDANLDVLMIEASPGNQVRRFIGTLGPTLARKTADETRAAGSLATDDGDMTVACVAGSMYEIEVYVQYSGSDNPESSLDVAITGPVAAATDISYGLVSSGQAVAPSNVDGSGTVIQDAGTDGTPTNRITLLMKGLITTDAAGFVTFQWGDDTDDLPGETITLHANSYIKITRIN
jgi:hypothetical protein